MNHISNGEIGDYAYINIQLDDSQKALFNTQISILESIYNQYVHHFYKHYPNKPIEPEDFIKLKYITKNECIPEAFKKPYNKICINRVPQVALRVIVKKAHRDCNRAIKTYSDLDSIKSHIQLFEGSDYENIDNKKLKKIYIRKDGFSLNKKDPFKIKLSSFGTCYLVAPILDEPITPDHAHVNKELFNKRISAFLIKKDEDDFRLAIKFPKNIIPDKYLKVSSFNEYSQYILFLINPSNLIASTIITQEMIENNNSIQDINYINNPIDTDFNLKSLYKKYIYYDSIIEEENRKDWKLYLCNNGINPIQMESIRSKLSYNEKLELDHTIHNDNQVYKENNILKFNIQDEIRNIMSQTYYNYIDNIINTCIYEYKQSNTMIIIPYYNFNKLNMKMNKEYANKKNKFLVDYPIQYQQILNLGEFIKTINDKSKMYDFINIRFISMPFDEIYNNFTLNSINKYIIDDNFRKSFNSLWKLFKIQFM